MEHRKAEAAYIRIQTEQLNSTGLPAGTIGRVSPTVAATHTRATSPLPTVAGTATTTFTTLATALGVLGVDHLII